MQINYFADEPDVATSFTFSNEGNELSDFTNWLSSLNLTFTKLKLRQESGGLATCVVVNQPMRGETMTTTTTTTMAPNKPTQVEDSTENSSSGDKEKKKKKDKPKD